MKNTIKDDYSRAYITLENLEKELNMEFDWKKIKKQNIDSLSTLIFLLEKKVNIQSNLIIKH